MKNRFNVRVTDENTGVVFEKTFTVRTAAIAGARMCQWLMKNNVLFGNMKFTITEVSND